MSEGVNKKKIIIYIALAVIIITASFAAVFVYKQFSKPIIDFKDAKQVELFIPTGSDFDYVKAQLDSTGVLIDDDLFVLLADKKNYKKNVKPGKYRLKDKMTANELVNMLRSGNQVPIRFTFNNIRFVDKLAGLAAKKLELDSAELSSLFHNDEYLEQFGFNQQTVVAMFLPNTYEFYWNTSADQFMKRMYKEYNRFWNGNRKNKALEMNLSILDVSILASIVQEETNRRDEMSRIAGVYINRLHRGMLLQADPTARFAYGDFSVKRVTYDYLKIDSPYNTYMYAGLPPGPICMPDPITIDKVLNYEKHNYLFFCAKPDNTGYHAFAKTNREHNRNADAYHRYLNKHRIR
jgi:UPF0755 protein